MSAQTAEPTAGIIIIGAEVLSGKVDDANGPFLIRALRARGVEVIELRIIGDIVDEIAAAVRPLSAKATYVITTGGIGPTHDDVTMAGVAQAFGASVVRHPELQRLMHGRYPGGVNEARHKLTEVPEGASVTVTHGGFVPMVQIRNVTILPGVPSMMRNCFTELAPTLRGTPFHSQALLLNVAESDIAEHLTLVQFDFPDVSIGSYPRFDDAPYRVKVTVDGRDAQRVASTIRALNAGLQAAWIVAQE